MRTAIRDRAALLQALLVILAMSLAAPGCAFLGHKSASLEQEFYEIDRMAIVALKGAAATLEALQQEGIEVPRDVRVGLMAAKESLRTTHTQARKWLYACKYEGSGGCDKEERIRLAMASMEDLTALVAKLVVEAKGGEDG